MSADFPGANGPEQDPSDGSEEIQPLLKERIDTAVAIAYGQHGYVIDGYPDQGAVADMVYELVSQAVVTKRAERANAAVTRRRLMSVVFSKVAGPEAWAEQEDPEVAEGLYKRLDGQLWRMVTPDSTGQIQTRLNGDNGLILCRTKDTAEKVPAVYVTRDLQCLVTDYSGPHKAALKKEGDRFAMNMAMAIDRVPEHAKRFKRELTSGLKTALDSGVAIVTPSLEAAVGDTEDEADEAHVDE